ncbi:SMP-30/gluconolactonase/LRE family protein [Alteraurantiacibacter aquimixticola]|uniref:SMP-30/gluconolactonase/LRE family protein n=1 Tax=Alteraurantiacibacter aquimixticola TaxID=2489173 RepID=A0A4T3F445_9SPHN|nr:SMP-30/gluconolactonase/LRE family protein [Alteraurantiacibacter aquimixticola]TIX52043.1 SMP-30/gluconolactonase/LRE family protein [Alteraurantiacibacter aquimixticola]
MQITRLDLPRRSVGEGPVWDVAEQALYYIDILEKKVLRWHPESGAHREWVVPDMIGSMALREGGGAIVALVDGIHALDLDSGEVTPLALLEPANPAIQLADGKVDRKGRFIFGTSHRKAAEPAGGLFSLDHGKITQLDSGLTLGNGPCWSPDDKVLYHADSMAHVIYAYDYDLATGETSNRREFFNTSAYGPIPDGATVDTDGNLWTAICEGGVVLCLSPEGMVLREIEMPTKLPASCMFFGPDLDRLFVPSIDPTFLGREPGEGDGWNYVIDGLGVTGLREPRYHG